MHLLAKVYLTALASIAEVKDVYKPTCMIGAHLWNLGFSAYVANDSATSSKAASTIVRVP
jgi:hypothetical protein